MAALRGDWNREVHSRRLGDWPLPIAGGQPRHCTSVRPSRFPAVESGNTAMPRRHCAASGQGQGVALIPVSV